MTDTIAAILPTDELKIAVIGLGYVGLPLAAEFGKNRPVVGFDINAQRIAQLREGRDITLELSAEELADATGLSFTQNLEAISDCNVYIVTVPTPIDAANQPDLTRSQAYLAAQRRSVSVCRATLHRRQAQTTLPATIRCARI